MTLGRLFWRLGVAGVAAIGLAAFVGLTSPRAADLDPAHMSADEIKALEQRLTDAGCYKSAIDGTTSGALDAAIQACPDQRPHLRIETGMHTATIWRVGADAACRVLATASDDKTVRLWSLPDGKLERTLRLPIGEDDGGKRRAAALSPDGRFLATGGSDAAWDKVGKHSLTIVDLSNGAIRRLGAFEDVIYKLAFSADGRRVAVGLWGKSGVRVLDSATGAELLADRDYGADVYGLAFAPDGGLIAASWDGQLRRYGPDLKLTVKRPAPDGKRPYGVAIDPSGRRVAVGYDNQSAVSILDAKTLAPLAKAQTGDVSNGDLSSVAWSRDGATLVAGGKAQAQFQGVWRDFLRRFDAAGRRKGADVAASGDTIFDIQPCGAGFAFAVADPAFGLLSAQGVATILQGPRTADLRAKSGSAFAASSDASSVRFGLGNGEKNPVLFDLEKASLTDSPSLPAGFASARLDGLPVTDWKNDFAPKFNGAKLALEPYELSRALAVRPGASGFALGTEWRVRAYDAHGKERWNKPGPGVAWGVDFSADGEILVVAYSDGTIRWLRWTAKSQFGGLGINVAQHDGLIKVVTLIDDKPAAKAGVLSGDVITAVDDSPMQGLSLNQAVEKMRGAVGSPVKLRIARGPTQEIKEFTVVRDTIAGAGAGEELLALFVEPQSRKWVAWTPSGYYMASAGGEDLIGWHVNRGWEQEADFFPASQFRSQYNRPDIVRLVLQTRDEAKAIADANAGSERAVKAVPVAAALPPVVSIVRPADGSHFSGDPIEIAYALRSPSGLAVDRLDVLADGEPVASSGFEKTNAREAQGRVTVTLQRKDTKLSIIARSGDLTSAPVSIALKYDGPSPAPSPSPSAADVLKPKLYALLVGVTGYQNHDYDTLKFPGHDAASLAQALEAQKGGLYSEVQTKVIDDATQHNVFEGLDWLRHVATSRDIAIVFLSGHGWLDGKNNFWFLTREADLSKLRTTAISNDDLLDSMTSVPGKKILFIDACHSGAAMAAGTKATPPDMNKVVNDFSTAGSGLVVYAASTGTEFAHEDAKWDSHGAFAEALIEAIGNGKASIDSTRRITTDMLDLYVVDRVRDLTGGDQHPVMNRPVLIPDFPLALARP
jgi:WD40 repeat protein